MTELAMRDLDASNAPRPGILLSRIAGLVLTGTAMFFCAGLIVGMLAAHARNGGALGAGLIASLAAAALALVGSAWLCWRLFRAIYRTRSDATPRERLNVRVMTAAGVLGGLIAVALAVGNNGNPSEAVFSNAPIAPWLAAALALLVAVVLPVLCFYWHSRVADEQEAAAYRHGALIALYVYWIGAPAWWLLWRGGLVPAPDGIVIYCVVTAVAAAFWFRAKYR